MQTEHALQPISADQAHVLLDALETLRHAVHTGTALPWRDYASDDADHKGSQDGYCQIMTEAAAALDALLSQDTVRPTGDAS